ncbi:MAG: hypothetical protein M0P58_04550 [Bacteroidales bacterium]|nr:hypothetical protein [Bacteroidales bacterium]
MSEFGFCDALRTGSLKEIRKFPKADLHNHILMGGRRSAFNKFSGGKIIPFHSVKGDIQELDQWIALVYRPFLLQNPDRFQMALEAAFRQAKSDGVTELEASIDSCYGATFHISPEKVIGALQKAHTSIASEINFRPELGLLRSRSVRSLMALLGPYFHFNYFKTIDLYDDEMAQPIRNFREIYRYAKSAGLRCKAHVGEFGDADSVKEAVMELELDEVQHGIAAAGSTRVMQWLADHKIVLNICPASNVRLKRVKSYKTHPIRILFDHGVKVTINTDDVLIFNKGISEQFLQLYQSGLFTANELDIIRQNGIEKLH